MKSTTFSSCCRPGSKKQAQLSPEADTIAMSMYPRLNMIFPLHKFPLVRAGLADSAGFRIRLSSFLFSLGSPSQLAYAANRALSLCCFKVLWGENKLPPVSPSVPWSHRMGAFMSGGRGQTALNAGKLVLQLDFLLLCSVHMHLASVSNSQHRALWIIYPFHSQP